MTSAIFTVSIIFLLVYFKVANYNKIVSVLVFLPYLLTAIVTAYFFFLRGGLDYVAYCNLIEYIVISILQVLYMIISVYNTDEGRDLPRMLVLALFYTGLFAIFKSITTIFALNTVGFKDVIFFILEGLFNSFCVSTVTFLAYRTVKDDRDYANRQYNEDDQV